MRFRYETKFLDDLIQYTKIPRINPRDKPREMNGGAFWLKSELFLTKIRARNELHQKCTSALPLAADLSAVTSARVDSDYFKNGALKIQFLKD